MKVYLYKNKSDVFIVYYNKQYYLTTENFIRIYTDNKLKDLTITTDKKSYNLLYNYIKFFIRDNYYHLLINRPEHYVNLKQIKLYLNLKILHR